MLGHAIAHAVKRGGIEGPEVEDAVIGTVVTAGKAGMNVARNSLLAAACMPPWRGSRWTGSAPPG